MLTTAFRDDPVAAHSAQFPLGRGVGVRPAMDEPSTEGARPWGLGGMVVLPSQVTLPRLRDMAYDPECQMVVGPEGLPVAATAHSVSNGDGDEGPSEDWKYDFAPDEEPQPF